ncbi:hypothetical protein SteCoe_21064 [Stentor coeruleus]|uniref:Uncharacterized protein n=1 Tax=Stentor coeruleus TaxID=5963 RepID=A0A1R2BQG8_9CILI|nr:hypothetical protein SteCoe_21064 [Stentor coeruleus]
MEDTVEDPLIQLRKERKIQTVIKYLHENRKEDSMKSEFEIQNSSEVIKKHEIKERIDVSHEDKIKDPFEDRIQTIEELEEFSKKFPEIEFGISDEELCSKLQDPVEGLFFSVFYISIKKKEKFSYQNLCICLLCLH